MTPAEFEKKLQSLPEVEPDETDLAMLAEAERINDGSLHKKLSLEAKEDGVSLNQYILYKLAQ